MNFEETETVELKQSTSELKEGAISISAILNKHHKGVLYFGIHPSGKVLGQDIGRNTLREVSREMTDNIEPRIYPKVEKVIISGKTCIKVIFEGPEIIYYAYGRAYIRVGDEDKKMTAGEQERRILEKHQGTHRWEREPSKRTIKDVNAAAVKEFVNKANLAGRLNYKFTNVKDTLNKLEMLEEDKLLKAAEVLFCDRNDLEVQAAVFAGTDKRTFLDIKQFKGNIFDLLAKAETYVKEHMDWRVEFGKMERDEIPEVPVDALREALVNSICHRDYRNPKGNEVAIFKDRIEIYNPGDFPHGHTPEDFISGKERSILRNPLIAETLFKSKDIEKWGSGLKRILDECREKGVKAEFRVAKTGFVVTFRRRPGEGFEPITAQKVTAHKLPINYPKATHKALMLIAEKPEMTRKELAGHLGLTEDGAKYHLDKLRKDGFIRRVGGRKHGHWEIVG
jgi:ATP-dependent DNA helicase RecG